MDENFEKYYDNKLAQFLIECEAFDDALKRIQSSDVFDLTGVIVDLPVAKHLKNIVVNINNYLGAARIIEEQANLGAELLNLIEDKIIHEISAMYECTICNVLETHMYSIFEHIKSPMHQFNKISALKKVTKQPAPASSHHLQYPISTLPKPQPRVVQPPIGHQTPPNQKPMHQFHQQFNPHQPQPLPYNPFMYNPQGSPFQNAPITGNFMPPIPQIAPPGFPIQFGFPPPVYAAQPQQQQTQLQSRFKYGPPSSRVIHPGFFSANQNVQRYALKQQVDHFNKKPSLPNVPLTLELNLGSEQFPPLGTNLLLKSSVVKDSNNNNLEQDKLSSSADPIARVSLFLKAVELDKYLNAAIEIGDKIRSSDLTKRVLADLNDMLQPHYPSCKLYAFGSRVYGTAGATSDLDVFVDTGNLYDDGQKISTTEHFKESLGNIISQLSSVLKYSDKFQLLSTLLGARIPLIRCLHEYEAVEIDLTFSNGIGVENTKLLEYFFKLQPVCLKLTMLVKVWFTEAQIFPHVSNFMLGILVVFFLQSKSLLPSVCDLLEKSNEKKFISYWQVNFEPMTLKELKMERDDSKIQSIALQFFEFYRKYDYGHNVISPFIGTSMPKATFKHPCALRNEWQTYKNFVKDEAKVAKSLLFEFGTPMVVQSPFSLSANMTKGLSQTNLNKLMRFFCASADIFKQY